MTKRFLQLAVLITATLVTVAGSAAQPADRDTRPLGAPREQKAVQQAVPSSGAGTLRTAAALAGVLGLIFVGAAVLRRVASRNGALAGALTSTRSPAGIIEILGRYPLGRGNTLVLLRLDRRVLLLSQAASPGTRGFLRAGIGGGASLTTLSELTSPDDVASILAKTRDADNESLNARFQSVLTDFAGTGEPAPASPTQTPAEPAPAAVVVRTSAWAARTPAQEATA